MEKSPRRAVRKKSPTKSPVKNPVKSLGLLDGTTLKLIAMVSMVIDHVGDQFFPGQTWMRVVGRIAMPIFAFCVAEGYIYTRDRKKYLARLLAFALASELPFDLYAYGRVNLGHQNIMFTFALSILALMAFDRISEKGEGMTWYALGVGAVILVGIVSVILCMDYNFDAVGLVFVFYVFRESGALIRNFAGLTFHALARNVGIYRWGFLGFIPIMLYNGKRGRGLKWFFYAFYPGHLTFLWLVKLILGI